MQQTAVQVFAVLNVFFRESAVRTLGRAPADKARRNAAPAQLVAFVALLDANSTNFLFKTTLVRLLRFIVTKNFCKFCK